MKAPGLTTPPQNHVLFSHCITQLAHQSGSRQSSLPKKMSPFSTAISPEAAAHSRDWFKNCSSNVIKSADDAVHEVFFFFFWKSHLRALSWYFEISPFSFFFFNLGIENQHSKPWKKTTWTCENLMVQSYMWTLFKRYTCICLYFAFLKERGVYFSTLLKHISHN